MLLSILKDSVILFLLIYALISLAEQLVRFLSHHLPPKRVPAQGFYVLDSMDIPAEGLESAIRSAIMKKQDKILLITEENPEQAGLISLLCNEYEHITPLTRQEFIQHFTAETAWDISSKTKSEEAPGRYI